MDEVFKALADPHRRLLLDLLFERDGRTLVELQAHLPMTRFGAMKHLRVLEEAGLVTARKVGREKHHYLNPVPIQQVYDRWVGKYAAPWARALTGLKYLLEGDMADTRTHVFEIYIRTTPDRLWQALTDGDLTRQYYFGYRVASDWLPGSPYHYDAADGTLCIEGEILEAEPPRRLIQTFQPIWTPGAASEQSSTVTWDIEPVGAACKLTLVHEGLDLASPRTRDIVAGWARVLSGLKTLLETGESLAIAT